jgi:hypothetical protein
MPDPWGGYQQCVGCNGMYPEVHVTLVGDKWVCAWCAVRSGSAERVVELALARGRW